MNISEILISDLENLKPLQPDGWPDIKPYFHFYVHSPFCRPIKLSDNSNKLIAIGTAIFHQASAWFAHIIVHKDFRNNGSGTKITEALLKHIDTSEYPTISLIATELGAPVYKKFGFEEITKYHFFKSVPSVSFELDNTLLRPSSEEHFSEILNLDRAIAGEDRRELLNSHLQNAIVCCQAGAMSGFYLPTLNEGLVVADNPTAGIALLKRRLAEKPVSIVPQDNVAAINFLESSGFYKYQEGTRMSLGKKINFKGELLYNRVGGNLG